MFPKKGLNRSIRKKETGLGEMKEELYDLYCPACGKKMRDILFIGKDGLRYPEKQCPACKTIYQLASNSNTGAKTPQEVILIPRNKKWLEKNGKKHIKGALPKSW